jgi:protein gp37
LAAGLFPADKKLSAYSLPIGNAQKHFRDIPKKNLFEKEEELKYSRVVFFFKQKGKKINSNSFSYLQ